MATTVQAPTGTVTFLFTDIEGSTPLAERYPAEMPALLAQHDAILRQAIEANGGFVFRVSGDAFCAAFPAAGAALNAGLHAQRRLRAAAWHPAPVTVRMGVHTGQAQANSSDELGAGYSGYLTLTRTQRVMAAAHGGQILVSGITAELLQGDLPEGVGLRALGPHRLKGLVSPEHLWQVTAPDLPAEFPPLSTLSARPNNLPVALTAFLGRQTELAETHRLLAQSRLITLTGPGGTGKTRLALQAAAEALDDPAFPDGAWLVELAPISNPELVLPAAAAALRVPEHPGRTLEAALADFLHAKLLLLILDNCEHLIDTCARAAQRFLQAGPGIKVLASSREPLGIAGETIVRVPSLAVPQVTAPVDELFQNEAVQLFVERARAVKPGFALTPQNAAAVAQICRRLDGIPLAIELAAARVAVFSPAAIVARLDDRFRLLTGSNRSAMPRQQTLEALIDWSYDLLAPEEKALFHTLAVFAGGFTFAAAEGVMAGDILEPLSQLVNKSLVLAEEDEAGETRYRLLETIRQYARGKLLAAGAVEAVRDRHLDYYDRFSREEEAQLGEANQRRWAQLLEAERDNLRTAIEWALERRPDAAMDMVSRQAIFWGQRGYTTEALRWLEAGIEKLSRSESGAAQPPTALAHAYWAKSVLHEVLGDIPPAFAAITESVRLWRATGDKRGLARALSQMGSWGVFFGMPNAYHAATDEGLALARANHFDEVVGLALNGLGIEKMLEGDYAAAREHIEESVAVLRKAGNARFANIGLVTLGQIACLQGDLATAKAHYRESLAHFQEYRMPYYANIARGGLADALRLNKEYPEAVQTQLEALAEWQELGNPGAVARCLECLGFIACRLAQAAAPAAQPALARRAGRLLGAAEALRDASGTSMTFYEREEYDTHSAALQAVGPPEALAASWREGRALAMDQVLAVAEGLA